MIISIFFPCFSRLTNDFNSLIIIFWLTENVLVSFFRLFTRHINFIFICTHLALGNPSACLPFCLSAKSVLIKSVRGEISAENYDVAYIKCFQCLP